MDQAWDETYVRGGRVARSQQRRRSRSLVSVFGGRPEPRTRPMVSSTEYAETDQELARRYLVEGRLAIHAIEAERILATCSGRTGSYPLGYNADAGWWCQCPASGECAHLRALRLITDSADFPSPAH